MIKSAGKINEAKQNFLSSLSYAEKLSEQLSEQSKKCTEIEEKIKQISESKINYKDDEEYLKLENRRKDLNAKMDDIKRMRAANFGCRQKRINAAKATKSNVAEQRNNSSKSRLFIKFIKFLFFLPAFYLVYMIIRSFFHIFDDLSLVLFNDIFIVVMLIIYFIVYSFISVILDDVNERIMRKRKVNVTTEPFKVSDVDTTDYDERIDKFNLQIVSLGEELQKCKNDLQSYLNEKEKIKDEILQKENERLDKTKRELARIKSELDRSILVSKNEEYSENVLYLNVHDDQKDEVKALGTKYDPELKKWYVPDSLDYFKFKKWFNNKDANIVCNNLYLIETKVLCWRCGKQINIVCLASDEFYTEFYGQPEECVTRLILFQYLMYMPNYLEKFLSSCNLNYRFSNRFYDVYKGLNNGCYLCNICESCGVIQGDFFLHQLDKPRRGFYQCIDGTDENLKMYKLNNLCGAVELKGLMHSRNYFEHMRTGIENLSSIDADYYILNQVKKNESKFEIDMASFSKEITRV